MNPRSLGFRVTTLYSGLLAFSLFFFGISVYYGLKTYLHWELRTALLNDARTISENLLSRNPDPKQLASAIDREFAPEVNATFIRITDENNVVIYASNAPFDESFTPGTIPRLTLSNVPPERFHVDRDSGRAALYIVVYPYRSPLGSSYLVEVGADHRQIHHTLHVLVLIFFLGMPVVVLLASAAGSYLIRSALRPIRKITQTAEQISISAPEVQLPILETGDEIEQLSRALNRMMGRLDQAFQEIHRFSADVSHELRTPLTVLRGELEALITHPDSLTKETLGSCLEEVDRVIRIVEQLLSLARIDASDDSITKQTIDLGELALTTAEQMHLLADEKDIKINFAIDESVLVEGTRWRLKQVLVNLLDNACKYSPDQGVVTIEVHRCESTALLEIRNGGDPIPEDSLRQVFDRFYRVDKARSRTTGGSGLGLAIVQAIVKLHHGSIEILSDAGNGTRVTVKLPISSEVSKSTGTPGGMAGHSGSEVRAL